MSTVNRRAFLKMAGAMAAMAAIPYRVKAAVAARVVVVGGGFGGATVAKYLSLWSEGRVAVTLVDANPAHVSCVLSNLVVTGLLADSRIKLGFDTLKTHYGITVMQGTAQGFDPSGQTLTVKTATGTQLLDYDYLVLSPGINFVVPTPSTWNSALTPHAWIAGLGTNKQTTLLKNQVASLRSGDTFVMTIPKSPYRCPPGPYERACLVGDYIKRKALSKTKVIVLDANAKIQAEPIAFGNAFTKTYKGIIEYVPNATVQSVNSSTRTIITSARTVSNAKVLNYIPNQRAGKILSSVCDASGFVPVDPLSYAVTKAGYPNIHVIGDSSKVPASVDKAVPKSAHMANAEAKVCADAILRSLDGILPDTNIATNSACYSPITRSVGSWLSTNFRYGDIYDAAGQVIGKGMHRVDIGEAPNVNSDAFQDMYQWADALFKDCYV